RPPPAGRENMVPMVRLELTRLSPPPPQDGVSTNFTTSALSCAAREADTRGTKRATRSAALLRNLAGLRVAGRGRLSGRTGRRNRNRGRRRRFLVRCHHAPRLSLLIGKECQAHAGQEEHRRQNRGRPAQKVCRPAGSKQAPRGPAAERGAQVRAFSVLQEH